MGCFLYFLCLNRPAQAYSQIFGLPFGKKEVIIKCTSFVCVSQLPIDGNNSFDRRYQWRSCQMETQTLSKLPFLQSENWAKEGKKLFSWTICPIKVGIFEGRFLCKFVHLNPLSRTFPASHASQLKMEPTLDPTGRSRRKAAYQRRHHEAIRAQVRWGGGRVLSTTTTTTTIARWLILAVLLPVTEPEKMLGKKEPAKCGPKKQAAEVRIIHIGIGPDQTNKTCHIKKGWTRPLCLCPDWFPRRRNTSILFRGFSYRHNITNPLADLSQHKYNTNTTHVYKKKTTKFIIIKHGCTLHTQHTF